jgi:hypothetical protein
MPEVSRTPLQDHAASRHSRRVPDRDLAAGTFVYGLQVKQAYPDFTADRVCVGTFLDATATFVVILYLMGPTVPHNA